MSQALSTRWERIYYYSIGSNSNNGMIVHVASGGLHHRWRGTSRPWSERWRRGHSGLVESQQASGRLGLCNAQVRSPWSPVIDWFYLFNTQIQEVCDGILENIYSNGYIKFEFHDVWIRAGLIYPLFVLRRYENLFFIMQKKKWSYIHLSRLIDRNRDFFPPYKWYQP